MILKILLSSNETNLTNATNLSNENFYFTNYDDYVTSQRKVQNECNI
jgi:hypothetical protein